MVDIVDNGQLMIGQCLTTYQLLRARAKTGIPQAQSPARKNRSAVQSRPGHMARFSLQVDPIGRPV